MRFYPQNLNKDVMKKSIWAECKIWADNCSGCLFACGYMGEILGDLVTLITKSRESIVTTISDTAPFVCEKLVAFRRT